MEILYSKKGEVFWLSKIDELKESLRTTQKPDDVIMAILAMTSRQNIEKNPTKIHNAVYVLSKQELWKKYLEDFYFDVSGISPYSELLDQVLSRLETSCVLNTPNPRYAEYYLEKDYLANALTKFSKLDKENLECMAKEFETFIIS